MITKGWTIQSKRLRWSSTRRTTRMWPKISKGADENCNRAITFVLWPLGHLDIWWEPKWRTDEDGPCETCRAEAREEGCCEWCGSRPCHCDISRPERVEPDEGFLTRIENLENLLGSIELYVNWRSVTKQLTTPQKELWADCVEKWSARIHDEPTDPTRADRWWRE